MEEMCDEEGPPGGRSPERSGPAEAEFGAPRIGFPQVINKGSILEFSSEI